MKIAIFGAGKDGIKALQDFGKDNVSFFIDNYKAGDVVNGIPVYSLLQIPQEWKEKLLIFVASDKYKEAMVLQLEENHYIIGYMQTVIFRVVPVKGFHGNNGEKCTTKQPWRM